MRLKTKRRLLDIAAAAVIGFFAGMIFQKAIYLNGPLEVLRVFVGMILCVAVIVSLFWLLLRDTDDREPAEVREQEDQDFRQYRERG